MHFPCLCVQRLTIFPPLFCSIVLKKCCIHCDFVAKHCEGALSSSLITSPDATFPFPCSATTHHMSIRTFYFSAPTEIWGAFISCLFAPHHPPNLSSLLVHFLHYIFLPKLRNRSTQPISHKVQRFLGGKTSRPTRTSLS